LQYRCEVPFGESAKGLETTVEQEQTMTVRSETPLKARMSGDHRWVVALLLLVGAFQVALALGAPFGAAAWGGSHPGVLPSHLRWSSAVAAPVYVVLAWFVVSARGGRARRLVLTLLVALFAVGAVLNAASLSWVETVLWAPVGALLTWRLWRVRRAEGRSDG